MVLNMIVAGLFGILVPVSLKKFNIDPALASSVFVTTITDVIGFLSFLGLGSFLFFKLDIINQSYVFNIVGYKYIKFFILFFNLFKIFNIIIF